MKLSILVPLGKQDAAILPRLLARLKAVDLGEVEKEVILLHRASTDQTIELLRTLPPSIRIVQDVSLRRGELIRRGVSEAGGDYVVIQEPDLRYEPEDYKVLLRTLRQGNHRAVFGIRPRIALSPAEHLRVFLLAHTARWLFGVPLTDPQGLIVLERSLAQGVDWSQRGLDLWASIITAPMPGGLQAGTVRIRFYPRILSPADRPVRLVGMRGNLLTLLKSLRRRLPSIAARSSQPTR